MIGFLQLQSAPAKIGMVGLSGGSLPKFCYFQLARLQRSFGGNASEVPALEKSNCIVVAARMDSGIVISQHSVNLQASLSVLTPEARRQLKPEFARITWSMKDLDPGHPD